MSEKPIRIVVIKGSVRPNNYTSMAVALVVDELQKDPQVHVQVIDPSEYNLPMPGTDWSAPGAKKLQEAVKKATAVVLATPEYHGSFSSVMKLVIENLGFPSALQGKPVALMAWLRERSAPSSHWSNCAVSRLTWARLFCPRQCQWPTCNRCSILPAISRTPPSRTRFAALPGT